MADSYCNPLSGQVFSPNMEFNLAFNLAKKIEKRVIQHAKMLSPSISTRLDNYMSDVDRADFIAWFDEIIDAAGQLLSDASDIVSEQTDDPYWNFQDMPLEAALEIIVDREAKKLVEKVSKNARKRSPTVHVPFCKQQTSIVGSNPNLWSN